jgi:ABC-type uncharacterized transport system permease subunit
MMELALPHISGSALRLFGENCVLGMAFPAHMIHIFQGLDLVFVGALKKLRARAIGDLCDDSFNDQINQDLSGFQTNCNVDDGPS